MLNISHTPDFKPRLIGHGYHTSDRGKKGEPFLPFLFEINPIKMKHTFKILLVALIAGLFCAISTQAQKNVVRKGTVFEQTSNKTEATKTQYTYKDRNGVLYPIYISSKGKCFIIKKSKKTGKEYRQYLPEITKQLSK